MSGKGRRAYEALQEVLLEDGLDTADRVGAQVIADARLAGNEARWQAEPTDRASWPYGDVPNADHITYWTLANGAPMAVSQPYEFGPDKFRELSSYCTANGLEFYIRADCAWWFPGRSLAVVIKPKNA